MLRNTNDLIGLKIEATDGDIGKVSDFLFDDEGWVVRYAVADTGSWLHERLVLISPASFGAADYDGKTFPVTVTRRMVEDAPELETDMPVSRQHESELAKHYNWPMYWTGGGILTATSAFTYPVAAPTAAPPPMPIETQEAVARDEGDFDRHLQSMNDVKDYSIHAADGDIGHVSGFILDDESWAVRYIEVDTKTWLPGKHVLIAPTWISSFDWGDKRVHVQLTKDQIESAAPYKRGQTIDRRYEESLYSHYGAAPYWQMQETAATIRNVG
jgi:uncharacterized protein YrrD